MTITVQNDLVQLMAEVCEEFLPEDLEVQIVFGHMSSSTTEDFDVVLMTDGEEGFFIIINPSMEYEDLPSTIASQCSCILAHLEGFESKSGTPAWERHMKEIRDVWNERVSELVNHVDSTAVN